MMESSTELQKMFDEHKKMKEALERIVSYEPDGQEDGGVLYGFHEVQRVAEEALS